MQIKFIFWLLILKISMEKNFFFYKIDSFSLIYYEINLIVFGQKS